MINVKYHDESEYQYYYNEYGDNYKTVFKPGKNNSEPITETLKEYNETTGQLEKTTDEKGNTVKYYYFDTGELEKTSELIKIGGIKTEKITEYKYSGSGKTVTGENKISKYDSNEKITSINIGDKKFCFYYDISKNLESIKYSYKTEQQNLILRNKYDSRGMLSKIIFNDNTEKTFKYGMFGIREIQYTGLPALKFEYNNYRGNTRIFTDNQDVSIEKKYFDKYIDSLQFWNNSR